MGLKQTINNLFMRKSASADTIIQAIIQSATSLQAPTYYRACNDGYMLNPTVRACVDIILNGLVGLPIYLLDGDAEQPPGHPLLQLLEHPNPGMNKSEFLEYVGGSLLLDGNSYIVPVYPSTRTGPPIALYPLPPSNVNVTEKVVGGISTIQYEYTPSKASRQVYTGDQIVHIKLYNPASTLKGLGVIAAAMASVDRSNASEQWNYSLLKNSAKQSGVLVAPPAANENQVRQLEKIRDQMTGLENVGKTPILAGVKWEPTSLSPVDMDWLEGDVDAANKIARAFRVPAQMVGIPGSQTYANMEQAQRSLYENTIIPLANRILDKLNTSIAPKYGGALRLVVDTDNIPAMRDSRDSLYTRAASAWWLTINERRMMTGWDELPEGDVLMVPTSLLPLEMMGGDTTDNGDADTTTDTGASGSTMEGGDGDNPFGVGGY